MIERLFKKSYVVSWKTRNGVCQIEVQSEKSARTLFADLSARYEAKLFKCEGSEINQIG